MISLKALEVQFLCGLICLLIASVLFFNHPSWDINTSALFYHHQHFILTPWLSLARHALYGVVITICVICAVFMIFGLIMKKNKLTLSSLFIVLCFAVGPGLVVNAILKNCWGRPRPHQITQFSGNKHFQKPWVVSNQCDTNCSFVAGDSSTAFAFLAFAFLSMPLIWRSLVAALSLLNYGLFGYIRIAQGGHFLSDVIIGALIVYLVILLCYSACFKLFKINM